MGWQDRDYAREPQYGTRRPIGFGGSATRARSVVVTLIIVNVVVYLACVITAGPRHPIQVSGIADFAAMKPDLVIRGHVWRLVTSEYLHWDTWHIFVNMFVLYMFGRPLEIVWGGRKFFAVYTVAGVAGNLFYLLLAQVGWLEPIKAGGASGCVLGVLGACAMRFPRTQVWVMGVFPIQIRALAAILALMYVVNLWRVGANAGGDACHLAGLAFGVWFALRGDRWWTYKGHRLRTKLIGRKGGAARPKSSGFRQRMEQRRTDAATVDRILDKIRRQGIGSLSDREQRDLNEATERQRVRERESGGDW